MSSRVLVVEDEAHLADGLKFNLEAEGYFVQVVGDGESAIDRLAPQHVDIGEEVRYGRGAQ